MVMTLGIHVHHMKNRYTAHNAAPGGVYRGDGGGEIQIHRQEVNRD